MVYDEFIQRGIVQTKGKASVSITYSKDNVALGHLAVNIIAGNRAPQFAYSTNLSPEQSKHYMEAVCAQFNYMTKNMWIAANKILV